MVILSCPRLQRETDVISEALEDHPAFTFDGPSSTTEPVSEERHMLDVIFRPPAPVSENQEPLLVQTEQSPSGSVTPHSYKSRTRRGRVKLAFLSHKLRRKFSREVRPSKLASRIPETQCGDGNFNENHAAARCANASPDILGSATASEGGYDSDAHNLLTPQITARLRDSPLNLSNRAKKSPRALEYTRQLSRGVYCPGYDGTPGGRQLVMSDHDDQQDQAYPAVTLFGETKALHQNQLISFDNPNDTGSTKPTAINHPTCRQFHSGSGCMDGRLHRSFSGTNLGTNFERPRIYRSTSSSSLPDMHNTAITFSNLKGKGNREQGRAICIEPLRDTSPPANGRTLSNLSNQTKPHHVKPLRIRMKGEGSLHNSVYHIPSLSANALLNNHSCHERMSKVSNWSACSGFSWPARLPSQTSSLSSNSKDTTNNFQYKHYPQFKYSRASSRESTRSPNFPKNLEDRIPVSPCLVPRELSPSNIPDLNGYEDTSQMHTNNNQAGLKPSRSFTGPIRSRFVENLDDVFSTQQNRHDQIRRENRSSSEGWLSGGKRVGYGYNFIAATEEERSVPSSEGLRNLEGQQDIIKHEEQSPTHFTLRGKRRTISESLGRKREAGNDTLEQLVTDPKAMEKTQHVCGATLAGAPIAQQRLAALKQRSSTFPPWIRLAGRPTKEKVPSVVLSSQGNELLDNNSMIANRKDQSMTESNCENGNVFLENLSGSSYSRYVNVNYNRIEQGFGENRHLKRPNLINTASHQVRSQGEPWSESSGNIQYGRGHDLKSPKLQNLDESHHIPGPDGSPHQRGFSSETAYDTYDSSSDSQSVRSLIEPCSADIWSRLYDDCVQVPSGHVDGLSNLSGVFSPSEQEGRRLNAENHKDLMVSVNTELGNSVTNFNDLRLKTPLNSRETLHQMV